MTGYLTNLHKRMAIRQRKHGSMDSFNFRAMRCASSSNTVPMYAAQAFTKRLATQSTSCPSYPK
eukprot:CAMPEP_0114274780 /NCGR_PEP_ID=MMETSP0058-20121206/29967_1 /TAXON_ID=36894 /ORGANISM="Pyramimonas parkeae, CCMP726" /LENGTH=63 /DNA_ID=CAMNT_0001394633 /DNA_START=596 /DNA_END=787 /DNA_ORIENTATION=-